MLFALLFESWSCFWNYCLLMLDTNMLKIIKYIQLL
uniref:Uncharacterized protein n=1 Tax=Rhizophora mucronata TaxID=61149 RepID=A0A2P2N2C4_RHIMU